MTSHPTTPSSPPPLVWWVIWAAITVGLLSVAALLPSPDRTPHAALRYLPLVPLVVSSGLRWLVIPKTAGGQRAFVLFIIGLSLAEGAAILGMVLVPELRATYVALGLLGVAQYAPTFARRLP